MLEIRQKYQVLVDKTNSKDLKTYKIDQLKELQSAITQQIQTNNQKEDYTDLEELLFYQDRVGKVREAYIQASKQKKTYSSLTSTIKDIIKNDSYKEVRGKSKSPSQSKLPNQNSIRITQSKMIPKEQSAIRSPEESKLVLSKFFSEKKSEMPLNSTFKSILEMNPVTSKTFRKKVASNNVEIEQLKRKNYDLKRKLQTLNPNDVLDSSANEELRRIERRLMQLEQQNVRLQKENSQLKTEYGQSANFSQPTNFTVEEMLDVRYRFQTLDNDLQKINARFEDGLSSYYPKNTYFDSEANRLIPRTSKFQSLSEIKEDRNDMESLSFYEMSKSYFSELGLNPNESYHLGIENAYTVKKNKVAFFKDSGVLVRDQNVDIAFKKVKTELMTQNKVKLHLYVHEKTNSDQNIAIEYDYETNYLEIKRLRTLVKIQKMSQGRQTIEISLNPVAQDLNTHATCIITVGSKSYKIWLPVLFLQFSPYLSIFTPQNYKNQASKTIRPHQAFGSPQQANRSIPDLQITGNIGKLWVSSKNSSGLLTLKWKNQNQLQITTSQRWIDAIAFIFLEFN